MICPHCHREIEDPRTEHCRRIAGLGGQPPRLYEIEGQIFRRIQPPIRRTYHGTLYYRGISESGKRKWISVDGQVLPDDLSQGRLKEEK